MKASGLKRAAAFLTEKIAGHNSAGSEARFDAFISYSHRADDVIAASLQRALETFGKPWYRRRTLYVFRDVTNLSATPELWPRIERALAKSTHFILMASPEAAGSKWVKREVEYWLKYKGSTSLYISLTGGKIAWDERRYNFDWDETNAIPLVLSSAFKQEPLYVDLSFAKSIVAEQRISEPRFDQAVLMLASAILDRPMDEVGGEARQQHRRNLRWAQGAVAGLLGLLMVALGASVLALQNLRIAEQRLATSQISESALLARLSQAETERGDAVTGALLALRGLPNTFDPIDRPISPEAAGALVEALINRVERFILTPPRHSDDAKLVEVQVSRHGDQIYGLSENGLLSVWSAQDGSLVSSVSGPIRSVATAIIGPEAHRVVIVGTDGRVISWRPSGNTFLDLPVEVREFQGTEGRLFATLDDEPERVLYVPGLKDSDVGTLIDPASAAVVAVIPHIFGTVSFSRDHGELRIFGTSDGGNRAWNAISGDPLPELPASIRQAYGLFSAPDANVYVVYDVNGTASSYSSINSGELRQIRAFSASINELITLSPNGRWVARLLPEGNVRLRSLSGSGNDEIALALPWAIKQLSFSADGRRLAGRLADGRAVVWDTGSRESWLPFFSTRYNGGQSSGAFFSRKSDAISTSLRSTSNVGRRIGGLISLWNTSTFSTEQTLSEPGGDWFYDLKVAPDESFIIVLGSSGHVWRFELTSGTAIRLISGDSIYATAISFSPDGTELLVGTIDGSVVSIDPKNGTPRATFPGGFDGEVKALTARGTPGSMTIAAAGGSGSDILVWHSSEELAKKLTGHAAAVTAICLLGEAIVSADEKGRVTLHRKELSSPSMKFAAGAVPLSAIACDALGRRVAVAAEDGIIRIFEVSSGILELQFRANDRRIRSLSFSGDGRYLLAAGEDHATRLWPVQSSLEKLIETGRATLPNRGDNAK